MTPMRAAILINIFRCHIGVALMRLGHVLVHRDMTRARRTAHVAGNARVIMEDLDCPAGEPHIDPTTDQPMRYRVEGLIHVYVIVAMNLGRFPLLVFEPHSPQSRQRTLHFLSTLMIADKGLWHMKWPADPIDGRGICTTDMRCRRRDLNVGQQSLIRGSSRMTLLRLGLPRSR